MLVCSWAMVAVGGVSLIFFSTSVLSFLLSFEFVSVGLMIFCLLIYVSNSFMELFLFMVIIVTESVLGLMLMLLLVKSSGNEFISILNVS